MHARTPQPDHAGPEPSGPTPHGQDIGRSARRLQPARHGPAPAWPTILAVLAAAGAMFIPAAALILLGRNAGRGAWDATVYHEPFIRQLARAWPNFDLSDPLTATTPGYHIVLATLARLGLDSTTALRLISAAIGAALIATLAAWLTRRVRPLDAVLLSLPIAASIYTFQASAWILPDNLAWLMVLLIVLLCLGPRRAEADPPASWPRLVAAAVLLALLVFTRQVHLWAAGVIWLAAWLRRPGPLFADLPRRVPPTAGAVLLTLPAAGIVAWFIAHWDGLTPPRFQGDMHGGNPATPAFILVQTAVLAVGFGPWLLPGVIRTARDHPRWPLAALGIALALALIPATTTDPAAGRYSGWWALSGHAPVLFGRTSLLFVLLPPIGAVLIAGALRAIPFRARWLLLGALAGFTAAQSATFFSWQRYHEPFLIMFLALVAALQPPELRATPAARLRVPAMVLLCLLLAAISARSLRGDPVARGTPPPAKHTSPGDPWAAPTTIPAQPLPAAEPD